MRKMVKVGLEKLEKEVVERVTKDMNGMTMKWRGRRVGTSRAK